MFKHWFRGWRRGVVEHTPGAGKSNDGRDMSARPPPRRRKSRGFVSEFEGFMSDFLEDHPEVEDDQRRGWAIWWNRKFSANEPEQSAKDEVPVSAYYYFDMTPTVPATPGGHGPTDDTQVEAAPKTPQPDSK